MIRLKGIGKMCCNLKSLQYCMILDLLKVKVILCLTSNSSLLAFLDNDVNPLYSGGFFPYIY